MQKRLCLFAAFIFSVIFSFAQSKVVNALTSIKMNNLNLEDTLYKYTYFYPNNTQLSIAFIEDGKVKFFRGLLKQNDTLKDIDNQDSVFMIGSITKVFTSTLLARAVVNHQVSLDETIDKILDYPLKDNAQITLKELANHTSGLPRISNKIMVTPNNDGNPFVNFSEQDLKTDLTDSLKLLSLPGTNYSYSNFGAGLLAYSLSKVEKKPYEEMLQQQILKPLKMNHSTTDRNKIKRYLVEGLNANGDAANLWDFSEIYKGCGSIYSSVNDLSKFMIDNFNDNAVYHLTHQATAQSDIKTTTVALGWHINNNPKADYYWHNGGVEGYHSCMAADFKTKNAIIILSNVSPYNKLNINIEVLCFKLLKMIDSNTNNND